VTVATLAQVQVFCLVAFFAARLRSLSCPSMPIPSRSTAQMKGVKFGLLSSELVLRGGWLVRPEILPNLRVVSDRKYVTLWKVDPVLNKFLTPHCYSNHPLKNCAFLNDLKTAREHMRESLMRALNCEDDFMSSEVDKAGGLDLDGSDVEPKKLRAKTLVERRANALLLPAAGEITMTSGGLEPWTLRVLLDTPSKAVAMEATQSNFIKLLLFVDAELSVARSLMPPECVQAKAKFSPRGPMSAREYWSKSKSQWFRNAKIPESARPDAVGLRAEADDVNAEEAKRPFSCKAGSFRQTRLTKLFKMKAPVVEVVTNKKRKRRALAAASASSSAPSVDADTF
jgi:hypothetical protein